MADDRFEDLGGERRQSAAERLAAGDEAELAAERRAQEPKRGPSSPYAWVVGIVFLIVISVGLLNVIRSEGTGARGVEAGRELPLFAAPLATGKLEGDANVDPAKVCGVRGEDVLNVCELRRRPAVIAFMFTRFADCEPQFDRLERVRKDFPEVNFAGIVIREPHGSARKLVERNDWGFPVAFDRDGAVSNMYGIGVCPTTVFARRGGKVLESRPGNLSEAELRAILRRLSK